MAKKDNLPKTVDIEKESASSITYANEVVATIAGITANEVDGIASMCNVPGGMLGRNKNVTKGVKVEVGTEEVSCDLYVIIEYDRPIQKVAAEAQENVRKAIEAMTGLHVVRVDVHVQGVSFEKENKAISAGAEKARITTGEEDSLKEAAKANVKPEILDDKPAEEAEEPKAEPAADAQTEEQ